MLVLFVLTFSTNYSPVYMTFCKFYLYLQTCTFLFINSHIPIYVQITWSENIVSLSSCHAIGTDIPDPFSPLLSLSFITSGRSSRLHPISSHEQLYVDLSWSPYFHSAMWRGPQEYITYELVPTSPAVSCMSGLSNLDSFHDGW